jgi:hypothetical protein
MSPWSSHRAAAKMRSEVSKFCIAIEKLSTVIAEISHNTKKEETG